MKTANELYNIIAINKDVTPVRVTILFRNQAPSEAHGVAKYGRNLFPAQIVAIPASKTEEVMIKIAEHYNK